MADTMIGMARPMTPRKRDCQGDIVDHTITANGLTTDADDSTNTTSRPASPTPSNTCSSLTELTSAELAMLASADMSIKIDGSEPALKKRKLTFAEKEVEKAVKQKEKEEREKLKADEKARKEEEKRTKDEQKRKEAEDKEVAKRAKEIEKAEKKKAKDAEKQEKEAEKARKDAEKEVEREKKEAEKLKKEKSQLRIASFFGRPAQASTPPITPDEIPNTLSRRSSVASIDMAESVLTPRAVRQANPEFERYILPFFLLENTELAPTNRFIAANRTTTVDSLADSEERKNVEPLATRFRQRQRRRRDAKPVRELMEQIQSIVEAQVDIEDIVNPLSHVPYKYLCFKEDVRPPYIGTYTKTISPRTARTMSRRPFHRGRTDTNYDYDSEAEWEEPAQDDEDINIDDEESESEDEDEEMHDFLDDEGDQARKRLFVGEMEPKCSGLCWQGQKFNSNGHNMDDYRMDVLHDSTTFPIDPFSTTHWADETKAVPVKSKSEPVPSSMLPPRLPLSTVSVPNTLPAMFASGQPSSINKENIEVVGKRRGRPPTLNPNKSLKMVPDEVLPAFKEAVDGSDLTKLALIEILKKTFPKCSKDAIKDTLSVIAVRVGRKEVDKRWQLTS